MTEFSHGWTTVVAGPTGDQQLNSSGYTQAMWADIMEIIGACNGGEGVAQGGPGFLATVLGGLVPGANTARIAAGGALVDGHTYKNTTNVDVTIPSAVGGGNTRIDRIVLRCSWAGFTVRITRIAGTDAGSPTAPAITQTPGTTYDIPLYQALVNTVGTVTLTDERQMANLVTHRQGSSATNWNAPASVGNTINYSVGPVRIQAGVKNLGSYTGPSSNIDVTIFPKAFSGTPIVLVTLYNLNNAMFNAYAMAMVYGETTTQFNHVVTLPAAGTDTYYLNWMAIGPA